MGFMAAIGAGMGVLGMGVSALSTPSAPKRPPLPQMPKVENVMNVIDSISGVRTINRIGSDGKTQRVTERLPLTPQEQKLADFFSNIASEAVNNVQELYRVNPNKAIDYAPLMKTVGILNEERKNDVARLIKAPGLDVDGFTKEFKDFETAEIRDKFNKMRDARKSELGNMGYGIGSSAWQAAETGLQAEEARELRGVNLRSKLAGEQYGKEYLANRNFAYGMSEEGRKGQLAGEAALIEGQRGDIAEDTRLLSKHAGVFQQANAYQQQDLRNAALAGANTAQQAQNIYGQQLQGFSAQVGAERGAYQDDLNAYRSRTPNFGEALGQGAAAIGSKLFYEGIKDDKALTGKII